jgi:hypothetical protein
MARIHYPFIHRRVVMNISRLAHLAAAIVISGIQWTAVLNPASYTQSVREVSVPVADDASDSSLPVVVVTAHRLS